MESIELAAYAKINLGLDVVRRLENGYHEVKMVMQTIGLHDTLRLEKTKEGIALFADSSEAPADENNLAYKAAHLLKEHCGVTEGLAIHLQKRIPVAAGMAGGSTDAAAVLKGMNRLFSLGLSEEELCSIGVRLGADVPYCIMGGTALAEGIGEKLTALPDAPDSIVLVAKPPVSVSTRYVYEALKLSEIEKHPDIDGMVNAVREGSLAGIVARMENVLESVTEKEYSVITRIQHFMEENGAKKALMSGSGPTVFGIYENRGAAEKAAEKLLVKEPCAQTAITAFQRKEW